MTTTDPTPDGSNFRPVAVRAGRGGWGQGLELTPTPEKYKVISVTGGGVHAVAQRIAELSGAEAVDGFRTHVPDDQVLAAVINCGGTARIGVYPRKRIPTVDVFPGEPGGPLAQFITEDIFVSAVGVSSRPSPQPLRPARTNTVRYSGVLPPSSVVVIAPYLPRAPGRSRRRTGRTARSCRPAG